MQIKLSRSTFVLLVSTVVLCGLPFVLYFIEKIIGVLPDAETWYYTGANHGPWRSRIEGFTVYYPVIILLLITFFFGIKQAVKKSWKNFLFDLSLIIVQLFSIFLQMYFLTWAID